MRKPALRPEAPDATVPRSTTATRRPRRSKARAAATPQIPAPITTASAWTTSGLGLKRQWEMVMGSSYRGPWLGESRSSGAHREGRRGATMPRPGEEGDADEGGHEAGAGAAALARAGA